MDTVIENYFDFEKCEGCGKCLIECPVFDYTGEQAKAEKQKLIRGEKTEVLEKCSSCYSCDVFCPNDCEPYGLILYRWFERYRDKGIPIRALSGLPVEERNFISFAIADHTEAEKKLTAQWQKNAHSELAGEDVLFAGCNAHFFPYLLSTPLLSGIKIIGEFGFCCGEEYYRMGVFDRVGELARDMEARYRKIKPARVITFCMAGYNMQKNILPQKFGAKFDHETIYIGDWLLEKVEKGEIEFTRSLNKKVVLQESCHSKVLGADFMEKPRKLLKAAGAEIIEMDPCREKQVCCGAADAVARCNPLDLWKGANRQWRQACESGADIFGVYCGTCYLVLQMAAYKYSPLKCMHLLEMLDYAAGGSLPSLSQKRASAVKWKTMLSSTGKLLSRKRVFPKK